MRSRSDALPSTELALTDKQKQTVLAFLDDKDRSLLLEDWLAEWGISSFKAKLVVKLLLPALQKSLGGVAERGLERLHYTLLEHFGFYDNLSGRVGAWLFYKIENKRVPEKVLKRWIDRPPPDASAEDWAKLDRQTQVELAELEKLNVIVLALDDLKASVSLQIDRPVPLKREPLNRLLRAYNGFVPLIGRDAELAELADFCDHESPFRWMVFAGDGGVGKTRLALEFAAKLEADGWAAGLLSAEGLKHWVHHDGFPRWSPITHTLVVVDYAASKVQDLKPLLERFGRWSMENAADAKLRLLLLEREGNTAAGWVHILISSAESGLRDQISDSLGTVREIKAPGRENPDETMVQILRATFEGWAKLPGPPPPAFPELTRDDLRRFRRTTEGRPLFLEMAALRACAENRAASLARWDRAELLTDAIARERDYILRACRGDATQTLLVERGVALLTLTGPRSKGDSRWLDLLRWDAQACGYAAVQPGEISRRIRQLVRGVQGDDVQTINPLGPDILGEALAVSVLKDNPATAAAALQAAIEYSGPTVWANLLRSVTDLYALADFSVLETWAKEIVGRRPTDELALAARLVPQQTVSLASLAASLDEALLRAVKEGPNADRDRARVLSNLGVRYSALGRREEGLRAAERASEIYQRLATQNPDAFEPDLAMSLNNLGSFYSALGRREEGLRAAERASEIYQRLATQNPDAFEPDLAMSLNNLGIRYSALGRREEGLQAAERAVEIRERLATQNPDAFEPDLAGSLNNLGNRYSALGRREEGLRAAERASEIYQSLAAQNPDAFEPDLAMSLNNLGGFYSALGRREEGLRAAERGNEIYQRLAARNPDAFEPDLAESFGTVGRIHSGLDPELAMADFGCAVQTLQRHFLQSPVAFASLMDALVRDYLRICNALSKRADMAILAPILEKLQSTRVANPDG
jgi:Tetratricopeptide repeat